MSCLIPDSSSKECREASAILLNISTGQLFLDISHRKRHYDSGQNRTANAIMIPARTGQRARDDKATT
jgi:hypothetical protein